MGNIRKKLLAFIATLAVLLGMSALVNTSSANAASGSTAGGPSTCGGWSYLSVYTCYDASDKVIYVYYGGGLVKASNIELCTSASSQVWSNMQNAYGAAFPNPYPGTGVTVNLTANTCSYTGIKLYSQSVADTVGQYATAGAIMITIP